MTDLCIQKIKAPILLVHAEDDPTVPNIHSITLFEGLLEPLLPPLPFTMEELAGLSGDSWKQVNAAFEARRQARESLVSQHTIEDFAKAAQFPRKDAGMVKHVETRWGGHVNILKSEGLLNIIDDFFSMSHL